MCDGQSAALREWALTSSPLSNGGLESWDRGWEVVAGRLRGWSLGDVLPPAQPRRSVGLVRVRESGNVRDGWVVPCM